VQVVAADKKYVAVHVTPVGAPGVNVEPDIVVPVVGAVHVEAYPADGTVIPPAQLTHPPAYILGEVPNVKRT